MSRRQVAATCCLVCHGAFLRLCRCDRILSLRCVARIQTSLNLCDTSQRQNERKQRCRSVLHLCDKSLLKNINSPMRDRHSFVPWIGKLVHIPTLQNSLRKHRTSALSQRLVLKQYIRINLSQRPVAPTCRLVCFDLYNIKIRRQACVVLQNNHWDKALVRCTSSKLGRVGMWTCFPI